MLKVKLNDQAESDQLSTSFVLSNESESTMLTEEMLTRFILKMNHSLISNWFTDRENN